MPKKFNIKSFLKLSPEEQAKSIERETKQLIQRLPTLKKQLKMYGDTSDELYNLQRDEVELIGLCTDICVVSNALLVKAYFHEIKVSVDSSCCAGVTPLSHNEALNTMRMCQIEVK